MNYTAQLAKEGHLLTRPAPRPKKSKVIPKMSEKRAKQIEEYMKKRKDYLRERPLCNAWSRIHGWAMDAGLKAFRRERATEIHHKRGRIGKMLLDERFWVAVSRTSHNWIHAHPTEARKLGLLA